jgi:hypothetical protein
MPRTVKHTDARATDKMSESQVVKQLKIKTGVLQRCVLPSCSAHFSCAPFTRNAAERELHLVPFPPSIPRRTHKELLHYHKELEQQKEKVAKMRDAGADEYDIKKQVRLLLVFREAVARPFAA